MSNWVQASKLMPALVLSTVCALTLAACGSSSKEAGSSGHSTTTSTAQETQATQEEGKESQATKEEEESQATQEEGKTTKEGEAKISSATIKGLGSILVDSQGNTLYTFAPDKAKAVTCVGSCAKIWPPASLSGGEKPIASGAVKQSLLGSDPDPEGGRVITYSGWPLYTYAADVRPGSALGQALDVSGGLWYVISPSGEVIKTKP